MTRSLTAGTSPRAQAATPRRARAGRPARRASRKQTCSPPRNELASGGSPAGSCRSADHPAGQDSGGMADDGSRQVDSGIFVCNLVL